jgi:hypothetical protein
MIGLSFVQTKLFLSASKYLSGSATSVMRGIYNLAEIKGIKVGTRCCPVDISTFCNKQRSSSLILIYSLGWTCWDFVIRSVR